MVNLISFLFQSNVFEHGIKPQTAETIEIENLCDNSQSGSFQSYGAVPSELDRESTLDSLPVSAANLIYLTNIFFHIHELLLVNTWCWRVDHKVLIHNSEDGMN